MKREALGSLANAAGALLTALAFAGILPEEGRAVIAVPFLLIGPGLALVRLMRFDDLATTIVLAIAVSLGLTVGVSTVLLTIQRWTPETALAIVLAVTLAAVALRVVWRPGPVIPDTSHVAAEGVPNTRKGGQP